MGSIIGGLDIGSLYIKAIFDSGNGYTLKPIYEPHHGKIKEVLKQELEKQNLDQDIQWVMTDNPGSEFKKLFAPVTKVDSIRAQITYVREIYPDAVNIIDIGGGSLSLIELSPRGEFVNCQTNSLCAAGTGSFLDEQAQRLGIDYARIKEQSVEKNPPSIATRCSVFAKSDLIHRQQEGYGKWQMWSGLCNSMCDTMLATLFKGKPITGLTIITGGVSQNPHILYWLKQKYGELIQTMPTGHLAACYGMVDLVKASLVQPEPINLLTLIENHREDQTHRDKRKPLQLLKSKYPDPLKGTSYIDEVQNEVYINDQVIESENKVYMGIDIGSTSTKLVLMNDQKQVVTTVYRKTAGNPITAVKHIFNALLDIEKNQKISWKILGSATTGSGRNFIGKIIGADQILNEISAHVRGAMEVDSEIDTIFEIGGQDSKYMHTRHGNIHDSNMNYICAAGTGSFVEEQCRKLNIPLNDVGDMVMGVEPPFTSDRCTVFMEQDIMRLQQQGYTREECIAAVMYSVVQNYMNKVVLNRYYSKEKVFFQGATARNKGLVAAFENLLGVEVVVSPLCHVMGSFGLTLILKDEYDKNQYQTKFRGLDLSRKKIEVTQDICELCTNKCTIAHANIEGIDEKPSWGYLCGRDPEDKRVKVNQFFKMYEKRSKLWKRMGSKNEVSKESKTIGIPRALSTYTYFPLWNRFFNELGFQVKLSPETNEDIRKRTSQLVGAEFCFPAKVAQGHVGYLNDQEDIDFVLVPYMISNEKNPKAINNVYCPYVESLPGQVMVSFELNNYSTEKLLRPIVDFRWDSKTQSKELFKVMGEKLGKSRKEIQQAWEASILLQAEFAEEYAKISGELLDKLIKDQEKVIIVIGRPYNTMDFGLNLNLPQKFSDKGFYILPMDALPIQPEDLHEDFSQVYWDYGQKILSALQYVKKHANLYALYLTNFNCGPDSFLLSYAEHIMGNKPMLTLELDEHSADGGYLTRIEAFIDVIRANEEADRQTIDYTNRPIVPKPVFKNDELRDKTVWVPPMHPVGTRFFVSAFRRFGYKAEALPPENRESFEIGRAEVRGSECLPTSCTIGTMLKVLENIKDKDGEHVFFMPTAEGPCRFGQYAMLHRMILNRKEFKNLSILSPSSDNSYQGIDEKLRRFMFDAILLSDILYKVRCRIKPYEKNKGETETLFEQSIILLEDAIENGDAMEPYLEQIMTDFSQIPITHERKPLVGIVGEIYVRNNYFANDQVVKSIEDLGAEAWLSPISEWLLYTAFINSWMLKNYPSKFFDRLINTIKDKFMFRREEYWQEKTKSLLKDRKEPEIKEVLDAAAPYIPYNFLGEAILTVGRTVEFRKQGADMVINCSPFGCMPGTIAQQIFQKIQEDLKFPILTQFYDGEAGLNAKLSLYLNNITAQTVTHTAKQDKEAVLDLK